MSRKFWVRFAVNKIILCKAVNSIFFLGAKASPGFAKDKSFEILYVEDYRNINKR